MEQHSDTNAAIWRSDEIVANWAAEAAERERNHAAQWRLMALLMPFGEQADVTFLDLGAGTGAASRAILERHRRSNAILADFSPEMMGAGEAELRPFAGRYRYVEFDLLAGAWPAAIPAAVDAIVTSLCVHHLPDERKRSLFGEIFQRIRPGGCYLNYDPVRAEDPVVTATWTRVIDQESPEAAQKRLHRTAHEQARFENHVRYISPLDLQLDFLRSAGFQGVDVWWKRLDYVIFGGYRPGSS
ncbi:MAG: class I SAM-dependent methyltransferase [Streptosporangiaceae bacterium]